MKQRLKSDCSIAAIARATGTSYAKVKKTCGTTKGGLDRHEIEWLLGEFSNWRRSTPRKPITASDWAAKNPDCNAVLIVDGPEAIINVNHAVSSVRGAILDPSDGSEGSKWNVFYAYILERKDNEESNAQ